VNSGPAHNERWGIILVTAVYLVLAITCVFLVPLWEAPDEPAHFLRIRDEARGMGLLEGREPNRWLIPPGAATPDNHPGLVLQRRAGFWKRGTVVSGYERHQPPGYYHLAAPLLALTVGNGEPPLFFNHQYERYGGTVFYHGADHDPPFAETRRGLLLLRLLSVVFGAVTVVLTWLIARQLVPAGPGRTPLALAAAGLTAFLPQFVFVTSVINNDAMAIALSALFFHVLLRAPAERRPSAGRIVFLALILAVGLLTEFALVFLLPAALVWIAATRPGRNTRRSAAALAALILVPALLLLALPARFAPGAAHWDPLRHLPRLSSIGHGLLQWESLREMLRLFFTSAWGVFGWMSVFPPLLLTAVYLVLSTMVLLGLIRIFRSGSELRPGIRPLFLSALAALALLVLKNALFSFQPQGRMLLPLLPLAAPLAAAGLRRMLPRFPGGPGLPVVAIMLGASLFSLFGMIRPFYQPVAAPIAFSRPAESAILYALYGAGFLVDTHEGRKTMARLTRTGALRIHNPGSHAIEAVLGFRFSGRPAGPLEVWDGRGLLARYRPDAGRRFQLDGVTLPPGETVLFFHLPEDQGPGGCQVGGLTLDPFEKGLTDGE